MTISNHQYHNGIKALSSSLISKIKDKGVFVAFKESSFNPNRVEKETSDPLEIGQLYHCLVRNRDIVNNLDSHSSEISVCIDPELKNPKIEILKEISVDDYTIIYVFPFGKTRNTLKYEKIKNWLISNNKWVEDGIICTEEELYGIIEMVKYLFVHPLYKEIMENDVLEEEVPIFFDLLGIPVKAKPDIVLKQSDGRYLIVDWKSTRFSNKESIQVNGERLNYHIQAFMYKTAVSNKFNVPEDDVDVLFLFQNKEYPQIVFCAKFNDESISVGKTEFEIHARDFMERMESFSKIGEAAFMEVFGIIEFKHYQERLLEPVL